MAATGTPTPNIGLRIPQGTDPASVDDINYNSNLLDTKLGAVGNTSVQNQIDSLNSNIASLELNKNATVSDCNADLANGVYQLTSTTQNAPVGTGLLFNLNGRNGYRMQLAGATTHLYFRNYNGTTWSGWREVTSTAV